MSARHFYDPAAKERVAAAIRRVEEVTAAEVVVTVRPRSGHYRHTDYLVGFALSLAGLLVFLFHPASFREDVFPIESLFLFVTGVLLSANVPDVRRVLTAPSLRDRFVRSAAREAFVDLGISRTAARTGMLVYVSLFERRVELVTDMGLTALSESPPFKQAAAELEAAVHPPNVARFVAALESLGPALGAALPRSADDVNELGDEMHAT